MIEIDCNLVAGNFHLTVQARSQGHVVALFGPSGAGKTTLLNAIAGLARPTRGRIAIGGAVLFDSEKGIGLPARQRRIGYVFQDARLFPHLTVRQNLLYARRFAKKAQALAPVVELLGLEALLHRRPRHLSGGEKQRVAIGRALLSDPQLLLLDEPLAALDQARKAEILPYLERLRDEVKLPILYVSHLIEEAARLADDLIVLQEGSVLASGPLGEVLARGDVAPLTGGFEVGALIEARVIERLASEGLMRLASKAGELFLPLVDLPLGAGVRLRVRPRDVTLALERPKDISALNILPASVRDLVEVDATCLDVALDCAGVAVKARITHRSARLLDLKRGLTVFAIVKTLAFDRRHVSNVPLAPLPQIPVVFPKPTRAN